VNFLKQFNVEVRVIRGEDRMGIYFIERGVGSRPSRVVYDRGNSAFAILTPNDINWEEIFQDAFWFHFTAIVPGISKIVAETCEVTVKKLRRWV